MSTPIHQLPQNAAPSSKMDDDPAVREVIQEMTLEFQSPQTASAPSAPPAVPPPPRMVVTSIPPAVSKNEWYDKDAVKRALIVTVAALVLFYPNDISALYDKVPLLDRFSQHDKMVRAVLLAFVLYILFWKLEI